MNHPPGSIGAALQEAQAILAAQGDNPRLEAQLLLAQLLDKPRSHLFAWPDKPLSTPQLSAFRALVKRRQQGEPLAYILGQREFWSLELKVTPDTLIPRPDTELLVEQALALIPPGSQASIADLGTGSGAIAAAIAQERPSCQVFASDRCPKALAVAQQNFTRLGLTNITTALGNWCSALPPHQRFNLILSNPPYIPAHDPHLQQGDLPHEPAAALIGGQDGLDSLRHIIHCAPAHLSHPGWLLLEHGHDQAPQVQPLLHTAGFDQITSYPDLAQHLRVSGGRLTG